MGEITITKFIKQDAKSLITEHKFAVLIELMQFHIFHYLQILIFLLKTYLQINSIN